MKKITNSRYPLPLFLLLVLFTQQTFSQTGPGGVGSSTTNVLWLKANDLSLSNGDNVTTWGDSSGNANDLSQPDASFTPEFVTGGLNGLPIVRFNKTNGRIRRNSFTGFPTNAITAIYVNKNNGESGDGILSYASSTSLNNDFLIFNSSSNSLFIRNSMRNMGVVTNDNQWNIINLSWQSAGGTTSFWKNGSLSYTNTHASGLNITAGGTFSIAGEQDSVDGGYTTSQAHFGDFAEVMLFNTYLNEAQQIIVSNYLATKYNLTISNDYYSYEGSFENGVVGIGRENASNAHTASMSSNILQIENASSLDDNDYLFWGHDNGNIASWTTTEAPNGGVNTQRLTREWRLNETGDVGNVDVVVETSSLPTMPAGHSMYVLMVDADGDFSTGASVYEMTLDSGTAYKAAAVNISNGDYVTIGTIIPTIEHETATSFGLESVNLTNTVLLNFITATPRTVNYATTSGTATSPSDFTNVSATLTVPAGNSSATYTITIIDDGDIEPNENFTITLSSPSSGLTLGTITVHTYTINDNDNSQKVFFSTASANGDEAITPVTVNVSLSSPAAPGTSVDYMVSGGTATGGGVDYTLASGTINFTPGTSSGSFNIAIDNDTLYEVNETIEITLSNPQNCNLGDGTASEPTSFTYTINDNDANPTIQFTNSSGTGNESVTSPIIQVELSQVSGTNVSVNYSFSGTATNGSDYTGTAGTLTILAGDTTANIPVTITDDADIEVSETIIITLTPPVVNGTIGATNIFTYTITDNDSFGNTGPGGVGDNSTNLLWAKPESLSLANGANVTLWTDSSGNTNNLEASASFAPTYNVGGAVNGFSVVNFNSSTDSPNGSRIRKTAFSDFPTNEISVFYVNKTSGSSEGIISYNSAGNDNDFLLFNSSNVNFFRGGSNVATGISFNDNNWHINGFSWTSATGGYSIWKDGVATTGTHASGTSIGTAGTFAVGGEQDSVDAGYTSTQAFNGDFAEVILYNVALNKAQKIITSNYLAAKYNLTLGANAFYTHGATHSYNLIGIGQADNGSSHLDAKGDGIVRFYNPSGLGNDEFLFAARNNQSTYTFATNTAGNYRERLSSIWRVSKRNDLGTVDVEIDLTGVDLTGKQACANIELVVSSNADVTTGATTYTLTNVSGNLYRATGVNFSNNDYFTIEYTDQIVLDGTTFYNGSGAGNQPNASDNCYKLLVTSSATGATGVTTSANVREIEVETGGKLAIATGNSLTVQDNITLNGEIRLVGTAQLLRTTGTNSVTGSGTLYRDQEGVNTNVYQSGYWSSPVTNTGASTYTIAGVLKDGTTATTAIGGAGEAQNITFTNALDGAKTTPITISRRWLARLINDTDWTRYTSFNENSTMNPGEGWNMKSTGGGTQNYTFVGTPNDGTYTSTINVDRLSLLGNPYPSALDANQFLADNSNSTTGVLYFYSSGSDTSHSRAAYTGGYATYSGGTGTGFGGGTAPGQYIPIGQAFFVTRAAAQTSGTVTFQNSQRAFVTRGGTSTFFSKNANTKNKQTTENFPLLRLRFGFDVTDTHRFERQLAIGFKENTSLDHDNGHDAEMFDRQPSDLALEVNGKESIPYVITSVGYFDELMELPLLLYLDKTRKVTFSKDSFENFNASIYIYDAIEGKTYNITDTSVELELEAGNYKNRFSVIFQNRSALHTEEELILEGFDIRFNKENQQITINSKHNELRKVGLYNMLGQELKRLNKLNTNSISLKTAHLQTAVYIVKVKTDKGEFTKKLIISK